MGIMTPQVRRVGESFEKEDQQIRYVLKAVNAIAPRTVEIVDAVCRSNQLLGQMLFALWDNGIMSARIREFDVYGMLLVRAVDNFSIYLTELLTMLFDERPDTLKAETSKMSLSVPEVLGAGGEVLRLIADKKVAELDGHGVTAIVEFFARLGADIGLTDLERRDLDNAIALRNLVVHRRGHIDRAFLKATERKDVVLDERIRIDVDDLGSALGVTKAAYEKITKVVGKHFRLDTKGGRHREGLSPTSGLYCLKQYWYSLAPYGADLDDR